MLRSADLYGVELDLQKYFGLDSLGDFFASRRLLVIGQLHLYDLET